MDASTGVNFSGENNFILAEGKKVDKAKITVDSKIQQIKNSINSQINRISNNELSGIKEKFSNLKDSSRIKSSLNKTLKKAKNFPKDIQNYFSSEKVINALLVVETPSKPMKTETSSKLNVINPGPMKALNNKEGLDTLINLWKNQLEKLKNTDLQTYKTIDNPDQGKKIAAEYASKIGDLIDSEQVGHSFTNEVHNVNSLINEFEKFAGLPLTTRQDREVLRELDRNLKELEEMLKNEKPPENNPPSS